MIITIKGFDFELEVDHMIIPVVVIENSSLFRKIVSCLLFQPNDVDREILIKDGEKIVPSKKTCLFTDYFNLTLNDKTMLTKIYVLMEEKLKVEYDSKLELESLLNKIRCLLINETADFEPSLCIQEDIPIVDVFKIFGIKFIEDKMVAKDMLFKYLDICFEIKLFDLYIFTNLSKYFDKDEVLEIYLYLQYHEMKFFCIECNKYDKINEEKVFLIDQYFLESSY